MKHIKSYESNMKFYQDKDYVYLKLKTIYDNNKKNGFKDDTPKSPLAQINYVNYASKSTYMYKVTPAIPHNNDDEFKRIAVEDKEILRLLTPEEIEKYESIISANKYNL